MTTEQLTDEEREQLTAPDDFPPTWVTDKALRIIDAQAADRAALVAQLEAANALLGRIGVWADGYGSALVPRGGATDSFGDGVRYCKRQVKELLASSPPAPTHAALVAQVAELTRERDDWRQTAEAGSALLAKVTRERDEARTACAGLRAGLAGRDAEVARLTEALAAAEREPKIAGYTWCKLERAEAAEAKVCELTEALAAAGRLRDSHHEAHVSAEQRALTAEARVRELTQALAAAERKAASWERGHDHAWELKVAAEARVQELERKVVDLEDELSWHDDWHDGLARCLSLLPPMPGRPTP